MTLLMSRDTMKREKEWIAADRALDLARANLRKAEASLKETAKAEAKAREAYEWMLSYDGIDFDERQKQRAAKVAILSGLQP